MITKVRSGSVGLQAGNTDLQLLRFLVVGRYFSVDRFHIERKGKRREPAADDARLESDLNGWLPSAACCGYAFSPSFGVGAGKLCSDRALEPRLAIICHGFRLWQRAAVPNASQKKDTFLALKIALVPGHVRSVQLLWREIRELLLEVRGKTVGDDGLGDLSCRAESRVRVICG